MTDFGYQHIDDDGDTLRVTASRGEPGVALVRTDGSNVGTYVTADKVEEVCAALREAAGLPPAWTVEKTNGDWPRVLSVDVASFIEGGLSTDLRLRAAWLLAAADEAEARANRPKLPTAPRTMVQVGGYAWVRSDNDRWTPVETQGHLVGMNDYAMAAADFAVLYNPEASE